VDHAPPVGGVHGPGQRLDQRRRLRRRQRLAGQLAVEAAAAHELQGAERPAVYFADLENLHDVGVLDVGQRLRLLAEALHLGRPGVGAGEDHLQRHDAAQADVAGLVDDAHAAAPQLPQHLVAGHGRQHRRRRRRDRPQRRIGGGSGRRAGGGGVGGAGRGLGHRGASGGRGRRQCTAIAPAPPATRRRTRAAGAGMNSGSSDGRDVGCHAFAAFRRRVWSPRAYRPRKHAVPDRMLSRPRLSGKAGPAPAGPRKHGTQAPSPAPESAHVPTPPYNDPVVRAPHEVHP
jgi:hypothetical protein